MLNVIRLPISHVDFNDVLGEAVSTLMVWLDRAHQRRQLAGLDDRALKDMGISRSAARQETEKVFWQV